MLRFSLFFCVFSICFQLTALSQDSTYRGKEFWAGYGHHQFMESGSTNAQELVFYLSTMDEPATVTITIDSSFGPWSRTYQVPANAVVISDLIPKSGISDARLYTVPVEFGGTSSVGIFRNRGIHIQSDVPIAVYSHIYGTLSSGASLLLPVKTWGYTYQSLNSKQVYNSNCFSWAYIIASEDNTSIEITANTTTRVQSLTGLQPGIPRMITLSKGQIYQIMGANAGADANGVGGTSNTGYELTGTKIRSLSPGKPIAVFSGSSRTTNPGTCGSGGGDNDMVQSFPLHIWGNKYLTAPLASSNSTSYMSTNIYKVVVHDTQTVVKRNGVVLNGLIKSSYYLFETNTPTYIEADKPVMVAQFMTAGGGCTTGVGDPDMYYLSPLDAGIKHVRCVRTTKEAITINYVTLIIPTNGLSSLRFSGDILDSYYTHPGLPGYSVAIKAWPAAVTQFSVSSDSAFTGIAYGMGTVESYGYNLGANFKPNNGMDPLVPMVWRGTVSTDWFNAGNWSTAKIPSEADHVVVPGSTPFSLAIPTGLTANCKSIEVDTGAGIHVGTDAHLNVLGK